MKEHKKRISSGDILEMMVQAGLKPPSALERERTDSRNPIISINGKDVQWHELDSERRARKDKAA